jgi:hypothetical protein
LERWASSKIVFLISWSTWITRRFPKPYHINWILLETGVLGVSFCQFLPYLLYTLIIALNSDSSIIKIRLHHYMRQPAQENTVQFYPCSYHMSNTFKEILWFQHKHIFSRVTASLDL